MRPIQRMANDFHLIEVIPIKGKWNIFSRTFETSMEHSLEIFRGDIPITSITHQNFSEKRWSWDVLLHADTILKVKLSPVFVTLRGQVRTLETRIRPYTIELRLHVCDATLFARLYRQKDDPILLAQKELERILNGYTQGKHHDAINQSDLHRLAMEAFAMRATQVCGLSIDGVYGLDLALDPTVAQVRDISQNVIVEETKIRKEAYLKKVALNEQAPIQHLEDELAAEHSDRAAQQNQKLDTQQKQINRIHVVQDAFVEGMTRDIAEDFARGHRAEEIWKKNPVLGTAFSGDTYPQISEREKKPPFEIEEGQQRQLGIDAPHFGPARKHDSPTAKMEQPHFRPLGKVRKSNTADTDKNDIIDAEFKSLAFQEEIEPASQTKKEPVAPSTNTHYSSQLGITLVMLSEKEHKALEDSYGLGNEIMFVIREVDPDGPTKDILIPGDFLIEINNQQILNARLMHDILNACAPDKMVTVRVLRMGQFLEVTNIKLWK